MQAPVLTVNCFVSIAVKCKNKCVAPGRSWPILSARVTLHYVTPHYITLRFATVRCATLHYATLRYTTLRYATLHYTTLRFTSLHYNTLHYTTLHYITLPYPTVHYTTLRSASLHYTTLRYASLHYTTLHRCLPTRGTRTPGVRSDFTGGTWNSLKKMFKKKKGPMSMLFFLNKFLFFCVFEI